MRKCTGKTKGMDSINSISKSDQMKEVTEGQAHRATRTDGRGQPWHFREWMIREKSDDNWDYTEANDSKTRKSKSVKNKLTHSHTLKIKP